jgi:hypothetical protein
MWPPYLAIDQPDDVAFRGLGVHWTPVPVCGVDPLVGLVDFNYVTVAVYYQVWSRNHDALLVHGDIVESVWIITVGSLEAPT